MKALIDFENAVGRLVNETPGVAPSEAQEAYQVLQPQLKRLAIATRIFAFCVASASTLLYNARLTKRFENPKLARVSTIVLYVLGITAALAPQIIARFFYYNPINNDDTARFFALFLSRIDVLAIEHAAKNQFSNTAKTLEVIKTMKEKGSH